MFGSIPKNLIEQTFDRQIISTPRRRVCVRAAHPLVATVNRERLGRYLAEEAAANGAELLFGARLQRIDEHGVDFVLDGKERRLLCHYLVGADGSVSRVRSFLGLPTQHVGIGINYYLPGSAKEMIWNFDVGRFGCGYSWIFPHRDTISAGAYSGLRRGSALLLKHHLLAWLAELGVSAQPAVMQADLVNHDFRGWRFDRRFLVGDAAGLASPLTGEGIFPAIVSGEAAARTIVDRHFVAEDLQALLKTHRRHRIMLQLAGINPFLASFLAEISALLLNYRLLSWEAFEMA